jgi:hypothetical protein
VDFTKLVSTYSLVHVDRVFACDDISDGAALGLAGGLLAAVLGCGGHFCIWWLGPAGEVAQLSLMCSVSKGKKGLTERIRCVISGGENDES